MTRHALLLYLVVVVLSGCGSGRNASELVGEVIDFDPGARPSAKQEGYPQDDEGRYIVSEVDGARMVLADGVDKRLEPLKKCAFWIGRCITRPDRGDGAQAVDDCMRSVPVCERDAGKALCCPAACTDQYQQLRSEGRDAWQAHEKVLIGRACFGLEDAS